MNGDVAMKKNILSMEKIKIPVMVALVLAMVLPISASAFPEGADAAPVQAQVQNFTPEEVADFLNNTNDITVSFPDQVTPATIARTSAPAQASGVPANATPAERREYIRREMDAKIGRNILHTNPRSNRIMDQPLLASMSRNPNVMDVVNRDTAFFANLGRQAFRDIPETGGDWFTPYIALAVYGNVINGYPGGDFRPHQAVTIPEFAAILARSVDSEAAIAEREVGLRLQASQQRFTPFWNGEGTIPWWLPAHVAVSAPMPSTAGFSERANAPAIATYTDSRTYMTRGDVALAITRYWFATELDAMIERIGGDWEGRGGGWMPSNLFADATTINTRTTARALFNAHNNMLINGTRYTEFELYRECIANPENGIPVEFLAAMTILRDKGIMQGVGGNRSAWMDPVTRAQSIVFIVRANEHGIGRGLQN